MGMAGFLSELAIRARVREASQLASEYIELIDSIGAPDLTVGMLYPAIHVKYEAGEMADVERLAQRVIDLARGDPKEGQLPHRFPSCVRDRHAGLSEMRSGAREVEGRV